MNALSRNTLHTCINPSFRRTATALISNKTRSDTSNSLLTHTRAKFGSYRSISQQIQNPYVLDQNCLSATHLRTKKLDAYRVGFSTPNNQSNEPEVKATIKEAPKDTHKKTEKETLQELESLVEDLVNKRLKSIEHKLNNKRFIIVNPKIYQKWDWPLTSEEVNTISNYWLLFGAIFILYVIQDECRANYKIYKSEKNMADMDKWISKHINH